jgi:uncharacterized protein YjdB
VSVLVCALGLAVSCGRAPKAIEISPKKTRIYGLQRSQRLSARLVDKAGEAVEVGPIVWTSAKPDVVSVDNSGRLVAKKEGATLVTATYKKLSAQVGVEVVDLKVLNVSPVQANLIGPVGTRLNLLLTVKNSMDKPLDLKPLWSSSNDKVATVSPDGIVTSVGRGTVEISAKFGDLQAGSDLRVGIKQIGRIEVKPATAIVRVGDSQHFDIVAYGTDGVVIEGAFAYFESSDTAVATVDGSGLANGLAPGTAIIRAQLGGITAEATLLVNAMPGAAPR